MDDINRESDRPGGPWGVAVPASSLAARDSSDPPAALRTVAVERLAEHFGREPELISACLQGREATPEHWVHEVYAAARLALTRHPDYADLNYYAGQAAAEVGDLAEAARLTERALQLNPDYRDACILGARIALRRGCHGEGRAYLEQALCSGADYPDVHLLLGNLWRQEGHALQARECYERALAMNADLEAAREALAALPVSKTGTGKNDELSA